MVGKRLYIWSMLAASYLLVLLLTLVGYPSLAILSVVWSILLMLAIVSSFTNRYSKDVRDIKSNEQLKNQVKAERRRLDTVINSINDAVFYVSSHGKVRLYNAAALALLDTNQDIKGENVDDLFKLSNENGDNISMSSVFKTNKKTHERNDLIHQYSDGQKINLFISVSPVRGTFNSEESGSNMDGLILIARDITKQKSLDDERDEFISVVSHELRTPVAITEGTLSNLEFVLTKSGADKNMIDGIEQAHKQVLFLSQMVNDLSTLSRAQRGVNMEPEPIDIQSFANETYNKYLSEAKSKKLALDLDVTTRGSVFVARMAIEEIMQNFVTNALKYTKEGSVTIGVRKVAGRESVEFFVKDTGIGISKSDQAHVFQRFWRSEDYRTRETSGTGLGLHVVEKLADAIHTEIELKSRLNHGSTFSFALPLADDSSVGSDKEKA